MLEQFTEKITSDHLSTWFWWCTVLSLSLPILGGLAGMTFGLLAVKVGDRIADLKDRSATELVTQANKRIAELENLTTAQKDYQDMANLNMIGKPQMDGDIVYTTPISKMLEGSYTLTGSQLSFHQDDVAEQKFRDTIKLEPRFPFSYIALGYILAKKGDGAGAKECFQKAKSILEKTTLVGGHHPNHDAQLKIVNEILLLNP